MTPYPSKTFPHGEPESRIALPTERGIVRVVYREVLICMKVVSNRPQDIADVQRLTEADR